MIIERLSRWVLSIRGDTAIDKRVFCFPHAGGGASLFRAFASSLLDGIELCAVQLPGREERLAEVPFDDLSALVPPTIAQMQPYLDRPFALFGHSMGALIAYEIARALCSASQPPLHLFVSAQAAPHVPSRTLPRHSLPPGAFEAALARINGMPAQILQDAEVMAAIVPLLRADLALAETYAWTRGEPLDVPMTAFGGAKDPEASLEDLDAWRMHSRHFRGVRLFPGDHFYLRDDPALVVNAIAAGLSDAP